MKKLGILLTIAISALFLDSCKKYESVIYENYTAFVNLKSDGSLVTDNGMVFKITNSKTSDVVKKRAYITCDVFKNTGGNTYDIRLLEAYEASIGTIKKSSQVQESEMGKDPVYVQAAMVSGGYVNIIAKYEYLEGSETIHNLNLVIDENYTVEGFSKSINLLHNGHGEAGPDSKYYASLQTTFVVLSFPEKGLEMTEGMTINLGYTWYESDGSTALKKVTTSTTYTPSSYIQEEAK